MKLDEVHKTTSDILFESSAELSQMEREQDKLEEAWIQLSYLKEAMDTGDFGILIGKHGQQLTHRDILLIKREIAGIIADNALLDGQDIQNRRDGDEKLRLLGRSIQTGLEASVMGLLTGALGFLATVSGPVGAVLSGAAAIGAAGMTKYQLDMLSSLRSTSRLIDIVDSYRTLTPKRKRRSKVRRFFDKLLRKSPAQIRKETELTTKRAALKARKEFDNLTKGLPQNIEFIDNNGVKRLYPIEELFDV